MSLNDQMVEEQLKTNADYRSLAPPVEKIMSLLESNIATLDHLLGNMLKYSNMPTQARSPIKKNRSLKQLENEFYLKMEQLKQAVAALSPIGPQNHFSVDELYFLILHIKNDDWIHLMRILRIDNSEMELCCKLYPNLREQKYQMLKIWLSKAEEGMRTHRDQLLEALVLIDYEQLASMLRNGCTRSAPQLR
ncbi:uncharacterized protein LOC142729245 isoform X2 [Rhinoderma darwinii]